jgi:hypothetical protein
MTVITVPVSTYRALLVSCVTKAPCEYQWLLNATVDKNSDGDVDIRIDDKDVGLLFEFLWDRRVRKRAVLKVVRTNDGRARTPFN